MKKANILNLLLLTTSEQNTQSENFADLYLFLLHYLLLLNDATKPQNSCVQKTPQLNAPQGNIYMGARYLDPKYSRWISVDPALSYYVEGKSNGSSGGIYNSVNLNLYHYSANNPVKYSDPDGKDWLCRTVNGIKEVFHRDDITSTKQAQTAYGDSAYVLGNGDSFNGYTFYNGESPYMADSSGNKVEQTLPIQGSDFDIFPGSAGKKGVNPDTLHNNLFGTSYTGPNNPKDYNPNVKSSFDYTPRNRSELFSMDHDKAYENAGVSGVTGALFSTKVIGADYALAGKNFCNIFTSKPVGFTDRCRSFATFLGFGVLATVKCLLIPISWIWED